MIPEGMDDLRVWHGLLDVDSDHVQQLAATLSDDEHARAHRFSFDRDRSRYIVGRGLLRSIVGPLLSVEPRHLRFRYNDRGKPFLAPEFDQNVFFSVAHSQEHAMIAVSKAEVGIDIEVIRSDLDLLGIADGWFSPAERAALRTLEPAARLTAFFQCWTRKEAYIKALGEGLRHPLAAFDVTVAAPGHALEIRADGVRLDDWSLHDLSAPPAYAAAVAVRGHPRQVRVAPAFGQAAYPRTGGVRNPSATR